MDLYRDSVAKTFEASISSDGLPKEDLEKNVMEHFHSEASKTRWSSRLFTKAVEELVFEGILTEHEDGKYSMNTNRLGGTAESEIKDDALSSPTALASGATDSEAAGKTNRKMRTTSKKVRIIVNDDANAIEKGEENDGLSNEETESESEEAEDGVKEDYLNIVTGCPLLEPRFFPLEADLFNVPAKHSGWDEAYALLLEFKKKHGHCRVPKKMKRLGGWVQRQRIQYRKCRDGEPTTLTRERYLKLREAGFLFWSKGINSTHYSNSPASFSSFNPKDTTEVKELKVLIEQQKDIIKEQKSLVSRYSMQIEEFLIWKDEFDLKTSSMKDTIDKLQVVIASQEKKITDMEEARLRDKQSLLKRVTKLEVQKQSHSTLQLFQEGDPPKPSEPKDHKANKASMPSHSPPSKKMKEIEMESPKKEKKTAKSTSSTLSSKVASMPSKGGTHELSQAASSSKSTTSVLDLQGLKRKREAAINTEIHATVKEPVRKKSVPEKSKKVGESSVVNPLHHGFKESKEVKHPDPELVVRVSLSKSIPSTKESQKSSVCDVKEVVNINKPTGLSKESAPLNDENRIQSAGISPKSLELQEVDSNTVHKPKKGEAVSVEEAGKGEHVTAPDVSRAETISSEKASKGENVATEEIHQDEAFIEGQVD